jgi:phosphatidate cytidylyltransferase
LKQRIVTGLLAGAVFLFLLISGGYWFAGLIFVLSVIGYDEYLRMNKLRLRHFSSLAGLVGLALMTLPPQLLGNTFGNIENVWWTVLFLLLAVTVITKNRISIDQAALYMLGIVYLGFGFHYMTVARLSEHGLYWTLLVFVCIWATDSGAYFTGYAFGKHLLWPSISPKKTIEGAVGGIVLSIVCAVCFSLYAPQLLPIVKAIILGLVIGVVGQLGDLMQSAYKRVKGIKDTGTLLPGHGGVLDRVDSWLIVFPFLHIFSLLPSS